MAMTLDARKYNITRQTLDGHITAVLKVKFDDLKLAAHAAKKVAKQFSDVVIVGPDGEYSVAEAFEVVEQRAKEDKARSKKPKLSSMTAKEVVADVVGQLTEGHEAYNGTYKFRVFPTGIELSSNGDIIKEFAYIHEAITHMLHLRGVDV